MDGLIEAVGDAIAPVELAVRSPADLKLFLKSFGWTVTDPQANSIISSFGSVVADIQRVASDSPSQVVGDVATLITDFARLFDVAKNPPAGLSDFWATFAGDLLDYLVYKYLKAKQQDLFGILSFVGILSEVHKQPDTQTGRGAYVRLSVNWQNLPQTFTQPGSIFPSVYNWGVSFDYQSFLLNVRKLLSGFLLNVSLLPASSANLTLFYDHNSPYASSVQQLKASPLQLSDDTGNVIVGATITLTLIPIPPDADKNATPDGFAFFPQLSGTANLSFQLLPGLTLVLRGGFEGTTPILVGIHPNQVTVKPPPALAFPISALAELSLTSPMPIMLFGSADSTHLEISEAHASLSAKGADINNIEYKIEVGADDALLVLQLGEGDGFIRAVLGQINARVTLPSTISWSSARGFAFSGGSGLVATIALHESIGGVLDIQNLSIGLFADTDPGANGVVLETGITGGLKLGPFSVTVENIGLLAKLDIIDLSKNQPGNLGPANVGFGFKPPDGLGISLDAGLISGGGYFYIDQRKHRYAGILECSIADVVQVKIIGVLDTVLPDGTSGFSLLLVITTEFPPIQLGFGFTLIGVGGVGGVNRTMAIDALRAGLRAHHLDSVLFPPDPIDNAPQIISDLTSFFPPADGRYVFGPMFSLGWGTPNLITLDVAVILEIPDPVRLAILGQIKTALPSDDAAIIEIHIDILGAVDFGIKLVSIDGTMYDSRIVVYNVMGDMALRLGWGDDANFALSLGGLNPRFQPPPNFPSLHRCTVSIGDGDNPRLSSNSYFAVTSNSLQFGANVDLYAEAGGFSIHGFVGFDALFIISPFSFVIDFAAGLDVEYDGASLCSIHIDGMLAGPRPWHVHGDASFHILFFDVSASVDLSWGDSDPILIPPAQVLPDLEKALADPRSWSTVMPPNATQTVSLSQRPPGDKSLIVHPVGMLQVREKVVPFEQTITKYGNARPSDGTYFTISSVTLDSRPEIQQWLLDQFSIGQYTDLTDDQKLTAASYQPMKSGISIGSSDVVFSLDVPCIVAYQDGYIDDDYLPLRMTGVFAIPKDIHLAYSRLGAGFVSALRTKGASQFTEPGTVSAVKTSEQQYVIASTEDLSVHTDILSSPATQFEAHNSLKAHLASNPAARGTLQVVTVSEAGP